MKSKLVSGVVLALTLIAPLTLAQTHDATTPAPGAAPAPATAPAAAPPAGGAPPTSTPPGPTEAAPTPEAAPVYGQEQPPPPTYEAQPASEPVVLAPPSESEAPPPRRDAGPFSKGSIGLSVLLGSAFVGDSEYLILGAGLGYFLVDGLEVGVEGQAWVFDEPVIGTVTPQVRYIFHMVPVLKPYVGTFYRRYIIGNDFNDFSSVGARAGAILLPGKSRTYVGLGAIYEHILEDDVYLSSDEWYPEITIGISL